MFLVWYAIVRFALETFRMGNWTFFGIPTAMLVSGLAAVVGLALLAIRHRPGAEAADRWGEPPEAEDQDEDWVDIDDDVDDDDHVDDDDDGGGPGDGERSAGP